MFFPVEVSHEHPAKIGEPVAEGVFPEDQSAPEEGYQHLTDAVVDRIIDEEHTRNRRLGNVGKHSPLARDGSYMNPRVGDFLPGFGPVKDRNYDEAVRHAQTLEQQRQARLGQEPVLAAFAEQAFALPEDVVSGEESEAEYPLADSKTKLEGLREDDRAGFLPTTHREKSQAYELLDYMEPGKYERGVTTRLDEIFYRQQREMQKQGMTAREAHDVARDSVRSVIREWGDYYADARHSWVKLEALGKLVADTPNPDLTLESLLDDEAQGETVAQLIRFDILRRHRDTNDIQGFDPLWVREDRSAPTEEKHKTVEDMFTHQNEGFMAAFIQRRAKQMKVGDIRGTVLEAKRDQALRGKFWRGVLESVDKDYQEFTQPALRPTA
jgi:hypothetical protein